MLNKDAGNKKNLKRKFFSLQKNWNVGDENFPNWQKKQDRKETLILQQFIPPDWPKFENETQSFSSPRWLKGSSWTGAPAGFHQVGSASDLCHKHKQTPEASAEQLESQFEP